MNLASVVTARKYLKWHTIGAGAHTDIDLADATDIGEGDGEMVLPAVLLAGVVGSGIVAGGYKAGREYLASRENKRYWADYQRNTGVRVKYPYRSGYYYNYSAMLSGVHQGFNSGIYGYYGYQQEWWK